MAPLRNLGDIAAVHAHDETTSAVIDLRAPGAPREYTYAELARASADVAATLIGRGFAIGTRVGILSLNRFEYLAAYFGIMRAGLVAVPLNIKLPAETLASIADDAELAMVFADTDRLALVPEGLEAVSLDDEDCTAGTSTTRDGLQGVEPVPLPPHADAEMLYTSGSSGLPKGVPLTHTGQLWALDAFQRNGSAKRETQIIAQPLFHMNGTFVSRLALLRGDTIVLQPSFDTSAYVEAIERFSVSSVCAVPTMWARALREAEAGRGDLSSVKSLVLGSAPTTETLLARTRALLPDCQVRLSYGTTEAGPVVFGPHPDGRPTPGLALGYPVDDVELRLVGGASDDEGVLVMRTPAVMAGYHNLPERSAAVLEDGWYVSGDVLCRDAHGFYYFIGRADDMFVCNGENVYPSEVEELLERHPEVHQAVVVPLPDEDRGQVPVAFLIPVDGARLYFDSVRAFALANGAPYLHPRRGQVRRELPMAGTNKIDRTALQQLATELEASDGW